MIKAVIFDLDGVLVDTEKIQMNALMRVLKKFKIAPNINEVRKYEGALSEELLEDVLKKRGIIGADVKKLAEERRKLALTLISKHNITVFKGARKLISEFKKLNLKIVVATAANRKRSELILSKTKLDKSIDLLITGSDISKGKPNPEIFLLAAKRLKVYPKECLVIEDSKNGVEAAKSAEMLCVAKDAGTKQNLAKADIVIKSLIEIDTNNLINRFNKILY